MKLIPEYLFLQKSVLL